MDAPVVQHGAFAHGVQADDVMGGYRPYDLAACLSFGDETAMDGEVVAVLVHQRPVSPLVELRREKGAEKVDRDVLLDEVEEFAVEEHDFVDGRVLRNQLRVQFAVLVVEQVA